MELLLSTLESLANNPFYLCPSLQRILVDEKNEIYQTIDGALYDIKNKMIMTYPVAQERNRFTILEGTKIITHCAFSKCNLKQIIIPDSVTELRNSVFSECQGLTQITIPSSVTLPQKVTEMGTSLFSGCIALENVVLPADLTTIKYDCFLKCSNLMRISYPGSCESWNQVSLGRDCFYGVGADEILCSDGTVQILE